MHESLDGSRDLQDDLYIRIPARVCINLKGFRRDNWNRSRGVRGSFCLLLHLRLQTYKNRYHGLFLGVTFTEANLATHLAYALPVFPNLKAIVGGVG